MTTTTMHDLHFANKILSLTLEEARKNNLKKISRIKIELGEIIEHGQRISPENLEFNLKMLAKGSLAENAKIEIRSVKGEAFRLKEIIGE
jgi:Zn finger protein HypA/HybF involved in hydrogenase expression